MEWWGNLGALSPSYDTDAQTYIAAVEAADGQALEAAVRDAINTFVVGCKADGIWSAIKASCILAGARTLAGALVPLVGAAPTAVNFVSSDYNRKTGLLGNGTNKYINSNRRGDADPQNSHHLAVYLTSAITNSGIPVGAEVGAGRNTIYGGSSTAVAFALRQLNVDTLTITSGTGAPTGLLGASRSASNLTTGWAGNGSATSSTASGTYAFPNIYVFCRNDNGAATTFSNGRISFYSIGQTLGLSILSSRVVALMTAFAAAIP